MTKKDNLTTFSISELQVIRNEVLEKNSKEDLVIYIDSIIKEKEKAKEKSMNSQFPVDWFNIDAEYIQLLHNNNINNLEQLISLSETEIKQLPEITQGGFEQISWARKFFDMTSIEQAKESIDKNTTKKIKKK